MSSYLDPYRHDIMALWNVGMSAKDIGETLFSHNIRPLYSTGNQRDQKNAVTATVRKILSQHGVNETNEQKIYHEASDEHVWLLRAEGLTYRVIGQRLGLSIEQVRSKICRFGRKAKMRSRKARFYWV